jgi:hypothetical protein
LYLWTFDAHNSLGPYPQERNKTNEYHLFWRGYEEKKINVETAPNKK